jgi:hypothetical protein
MADFEIACDESGSEGQKLIGGETDVFAHAGVRLDIESAAECVQEIRNRIRSPALEYKSNHLLREKNRPVLEWLLASSGPIHGTAHVQLIDKAFLVVGKIACLVAGQAAAEIGLNLDREARAMAVTLYHEGPRTFGRERWDGFLGSFNSLLRMRSRRGTGASVESFFGMVDVLCLDGGQGRIREVLELLRLARPRVEDFRARVLGEPRMLPVLDPLIPAIVGTVVHWTEDGRPVSIVHDEQLSLTEERIARLKDLFIDAKGSLDSLRLVDSRSDSRVQVADFLAGVARKIASEELNGRGDAELSALLRPFVDPHSIWGDARSHSLLVPSGVGS